MARSVLVINQYYAPDTASTGHLAAEICGGMARRGLEVGVIAGQPSYAAGLPALAPLEERGGVVVHRVSLGGARGRDRLLLRVLGYVRFLLGAWRQAHTLVRQQTPDAVVTFHNPPFVGLIGARLARRYGLRYTYVLYDIHPDVLIATGYFRLPRPVLWAWDSVHRWILRHASAIIVLGDGMRQTLVEDKGVAPSRIHVIPMWGRPEIGPGPANVSVRRDLGIEERDLLVLYAGNMGVMHPLDQILDAASAMREVSVHFVFVGDGPRRHYLAARVQAERLRRVHVLPFQPEPEFVALVRAADVCLVVLEKGVERLAVPSRAYTFLSAGKPLLALMPADSEIGRLVAKYGCGWNVQSREELTALLIELLDAPEDVARRGEAARRVYDGMLRRDRAIAQYVSVILGDTLDGRVQ
jgi:glycosyltransferase involved in cell wall biosynthesis